jgi:hypothetical protein
MTERFNSVMVEWKSIETAPKDGSWVQLWRAPAEFGTRAPLIFGRWHGFDDGDAAWVWPDEVYDPFSDEGRDDADGLIDRGDFYEATDFTHWMPLPAPPSPSNQTENTND